MFQQPYSRCWIHVIWSTHDQQKSIVPDVRNKVSDFLAEYAELKNFEVRAVNVLANHVHILIELPIEYTIDEMIKLLKGRTANWINENRFMTMRFAWNKGYAALSVSQSGLADVEQHIERQEEYHRKRSFQLEYEGFLNAYKLTGESSDTK